MRIRKSPYSKLCAHDFIFQQRRNQFKHNRCDMLVDISMKNRSKNWNSRILIQNQERNIMIYKLKNKENGAVIGLINETQLQFLIDELEEESPDDKDYYLHRSQMNTFRDNGADKTLLSMLESAFGDGDELEIVWEKSGA